MITKQDIADLAASLKRERDELHVQLHLISSSIIGFCLAEAA
jgi:hypothetical protein